MKTPLSAEEIARRLADVPAWALRGDEIVRTFACDGFDGSIRFVNAVAAAANAANHHPNIAVAWDRVTVAITSHDAGGLTGRDFALAARLDALAQV